MSRLEAIVHRLDDRANPVVVKELRQAVQNRLVIAVLLLSLLINVIITSLALTTDVNTLTNRASGQNLFSALFISLVGTCMVFVPLYAAIRLTMERNHLNIDLLYITTISPSAIIRGKFWAAVALTGLIYSASMPFLCFTYLLRGIDLPSIFIALAFSFLSTLLSIMVAIFVGSVSGGVLLRVLLSFGLFYFGSIQTGLTITVGKLFVNQGLAAYFSRADALSVAGLVLLLGVTGFILFYLLAVASISAKSSNRMYPTRIFLTVCWMGYGILAGVWSWVESARYPVTIWFVFSMVSLNIILGLILAERESWSPRIRRYIPRSTVFRFLTWLFYTGSAGGAIWAILLMLCTMGLGWVGAQSFPDKTGYEPNVFSMMLLISLFTWCYAMSGLFLRRIFAPASTPILSVVLGVMLLGLLSTIPLFIAYSLFGMRVRTYELPIAFIIMNPFVLVDWNVDRSPFLIFQAGWGAVMLVLSVPWFRMQWKEFRRYDPEPVPEPVLTQLVAEPSV